MYDFLGPEYVNYYVISGHAKSLDSAAERNLVLMYTTELQRALCNYLPLQAEVFVAPGASIDFIVFTPDNLESMIDKLPKCIVVRDVEIVLSEPNCNRDWELDTLVHG